MERNDHLAESTADELAWLARHEESQFHRLDRCLVEEAALRDYEALRAKLCWDDDRRLEAEALGGSLSANPASTVAKLRRFKQGTLWLIDRWRALSWALAIADRWTEAQSAMAFDLLGTPLAFRTVDPWTAVGLETPSALVDREVTRLERWLRETLETLDAREKTEALSGRPLVRSRAVALLRHEESTCWRRLLAIQRREGRLRADRLKDMDASQEPDEPHEEDSPCPTVPPPSVENAEVAEDRGRIFEQSQYVASRETPRGWETDRIVSGSRSAETSRPHGNRRARRAQAWRDRRA